MDDFVWILTYNNAMYTHIIFDIDNTMVCSGDVIFRGLAKLILEEKGIELTEDDRQRLVGMTTKGMLKLFGLEDDGRTERIWNQYMDEDEIGMVFYDGMVDIVKTVHKRGYQLGIVSSRSDSEMWDKCTNQIRDCFSLTVTADDVVNHKPHPEPLLMYMEKAGVKPEQVLYIGDGPADAGCCEACGVDFALAKWGCIKPESIRTKKYVLDKPEDILELLKPLA